MDQHPQVPPQIQPAADAELVLRAHASGFQIYVCQEGMDGRLNWTLKAPEATLYDEQGSVIGQHYAGLTWKHSDGSEVTAKVTARINAPDISAIPWLLLRATGHSGNGVLSRVTAIQRVQTVGGQPPAGGCGPSSKGAEARTEYEAEYYFYVGT